MIIGYGKLGRSMPLTLDKCGNLGGDIEGIAVIHELARRHPTDTFMLLGRNSGEAPSDVGLPMNVVNPWTQWAPEIRARMNAAKLNHPNLSVSDHIAVARIFDEITLDSFRDLNGFVMWIGQHGTSNMPLPMVDDPSQLTKPQDAFAYYCGFLLRGINAWRDASPAAREEVSLNSDARNLHKMRDIKWPLRHPVLGQHTSWKHLKYERHGDMQPPYGVWKTMGVEDVRPGTWRGRVHTTYARLELNGLMPGTPFGDMITYNDSWEDRDSFGLFINETRVSGVRPELRRLPILREWVLPLNPSFLHGTWSASALEVLKTHGWGHVYPAPWEEYVPNLQSVRSTFTTPASGSGWATAKPWEAFAAGTVCFFHPEYDDQDNILGDADMSLRDWLRVRSADELKARVDHLNTAAGRTDWHWLVCAQRDHFVSAIYDNRYMRMIEERIWGE